MKPCKTSRCRNTVAGRHQFCETCADQRRRESNARASRRYEAITGKEVRRRYRKSGPGMATRAKARRTEKGKEGQRRRSQRWGDRHPEKVAAKVAALTFHGERVRAHLADPVHSPPVSFSGSVGLAQQEMWRQAALAEDVGDEDAADLLWHRAHMLKPGRRVDHAAAIAGEGERNEPTTSEDAEDLAALADSFGFDISPHGPGGE